MQIMYYDNKEKTLSEIFGTEKILLGEDYLLVGDRKYPVIDDVIILAEPEEYTDAVQMNLVGGNFKKRNGDTNGFSRDVQFTFGREWEQYSGIMNEHKEEFQQYFDIVDIDSLRGRRVCDLGCGMGRFSYFLKDVCRELILVDFSDSIFVARKNLSGADNCLFFMCDLRNIPFAENFADFLFCLGVLHHLPSPALKEARKLGKFSRRILIYLYYALDNRPVYFRFILAVVTALRLRMSKIKNPVFRKIMPLAGAYCIYFPLVLLGEFLKPFGLASFVPLYDSYRGKGLKRIEQDVYDRFFTPIEQRFSKKEILQMNDTFEKITISDKVPYWHFLCRSKN
ncbi:MAG: class I SAM-dependent methyltransferase [bacterium]